MEEGPELQPVPVRVDVAQPADLQAMAELRYENIQYRVQAGELQMEPGETLDRISPEAGVQEFGNVVEKSSEDSYYLVAKNDHGEVVGMCGVKWNPKPGDERFALTRFYTRYELRRRKIGEELMKSAIERARNSGKSPLKGMYLKTEENNIDAQNFYRKFDFKEVERNQGEQWIRMNLDF